MSTDSSSCDPLSVGVSGAFDRKKAWLLIEQMERELRGYVRRRVPLLAAADDVFQDFCLRVFEHADGLRNPAGARSWLYRVLRSALVDQIRSQRRQCDAVVRLGSMAPEDPAADSLSDCDLFSTVLDELRPEYSDILVRMQVRSDTAWEVAIDLGMTPNNVRVRHFRARAALRAAYAKHIAASQL